MGAPRVATMRYPRWYPSVCRADDNNVSGVLKRRWYRSAVHYGAIVPGELVMAQQASRCSCYTCYLVLSRTTAIAAEHLIQVNGWPPRSQYADVLNRVLFNYACSS